MEALNQATVQVLAGKGSQSRRGSSAALLSLQGGKAEEGTQVHDAGSHFCPQFQYPSFNDSHVFIINLDQEHCLVDVGPCTWVSAARHPSVNHL